MIKELKEKYSYTVKDASEILDYHPDHIRRLARQGKLDYIKRGWEYRFSEDMLSKYLKKGEKER